MVKTGIVMRYIYINMCIPANYIRSSRGEWYIRCEGETAGKLLNNHEMFMEVWHNKKRAEYFELKE